MGAGAPPALARRAKVIYCPANLAPVASRKTVLLMHDLAALSHPEWYSKPYAAYQRRVIPLLAKRAARLITPSEFSRGELVDGLGIDPERISVVPNGVDARFTPEADPEPARRRLGLRSPYVLVVGTQSVRKNVPALALAGRRLRELGIELVSAGSGRSYLPPGEKPPLRMLDYVDDRCCLASTRARARSPCPRSTRASGFRCSRRWQAASPSWRPTAARCPRPAAERACCVEPDDSQALAEAIVGRRRTRTRARRLVRAGLERAAAFSWDRSAQLTDAVISEVLSHGR